MLTLSTKVFSFFFEAHTSDISCFCSNYQRLFIITHTTEGAITCRLVCCDENVTVKPVVDKSPFSVFQVRNLCYMVTRREKMKHTLCDLQEKIFHLQIQLLEEDMSGGKNGMRVIVIVIVVIC